MVDIPDMPKWAKQTAAGIALTLAFLAYMGDRYVERQEAAAAHAAAQLALEKQEEQNQLRGIRAELRTTRSDRNNLEARLKENQEALYFWENEAPQENPTRTAFLKMKIPEQEEELEELEDAVEELEEELLKDGNGD